MSIPKRVGTIPSPLFAHHMQMMSLMFCLCQRHPSQHRLGQLGLFLLYLTSPATGCQGGQMVFYPDDLPHKNSPIGREVIIELETDMLLLHKHGIDCMRVNLHVTQIRSAK
jgi:hypothetical protein